MGDFGIRENEEQPISVCAVRESMANDSGYWGIRELRWAFIAGLDGIDHEGGIRRAFSTVSSFCGLTFRQVDRNERPNILFDVGRGQAAGLDGPGNVLGWAQLPAPNQRSGTLLNRLDMSERWIDLAEGEPVPRDRINFPPVIRHEIGHNLGLIHWPDGLLRAVYDPSVWSYLGVDIGRLQKRYGPPANSKPLDPDKPDVSQLGELIALAQQHLKAIEDKTEEIERHAMEAARLITLANAKGLR